MSGERTIDAIDATPTDALLLCDRLCARCGFNLCGGRIVRERRYGLLVVPCPQCGQVAPLEEFPPLDRWVSRWTMLLAAAWLLFLFLFGAGSLLLVGGTGIGFVVEANDRYDSMIFQRAQRWFAERGGPGERMAGLDRAQFVEFWAANGETMLASLERFERSELPLLLMPAGFAMALGCIWSVLLLERRRRTVIAASWVLAGPFLIAVAIIWWLLRIAPMSSGEHVAWAYVRLPALLVVLPALVVFFDVGVLLGRSIARGLVRALLAPRLRGALFFLWTLDDRPAPRTRP